MIRFFPGLELRDDRWAALFVYVLLLLPSSIHSSAQNVPSAVSSTYFIDCSAGIAGDGSLVHPWNNPGVGVNNWTSVENAVDAAVRAFQQIEPDPRDAPLMNRRYGAYRKLYPALRDVWRDAP